MRKNKSKKTKVPVLDEKGYAEYLDYLKRKEETQTHEKIVAQGQVIETTLPTDTKRI